MMVTGSPFASRSQTSTAGSWAAGEGLSDLAGGIFFHS